MFATIKLVWNIRKTVKELKHLKETNNPVIEEIMNIINDLITILNRIKAVLPQVGELIDTIIEIVKKWFKK